MLGATVHRFAPQCLRHLSCSWSGCYGQRSISQGLSREKQVSSRPLSSPRFHRQLQYEKAASSVSKDNKANSASANFLTKQQDSVKEKYLLEPHILSLRLKKLCDSGKIDDAIHILTNAPVAAQNTPVWNTMIWETMKAQRYSLSYRLYIDMKRRGFTPTVRTFQTMFNGLARIEHWSTFTKQLQNAKSLYQSYRKLVSTLRVSNPNDPNISLDAFASYIRILGNAGDYQSIFDVYYALDDEGPLARNHLIYTAMFQAIHAAIGDTPEGRTKVAADARLLWSQMLKVAQKNPAFVLDSYVVTSTVMALSGGSSVDHHLAFKIIAEYYGLGAQKPTSNTGKLSLSSECLINILRFCNISKNYPACVHFYEQVRQRPANIGGSSILDRGHLEEVLKAHLALRLPGLGHQSLQILEWMLRHERTDRNESKIRPSLSTYTLVMRACWSSADWHSAKRTFELATGYRVHNAKDGSVVAKMKGFAQSFTPNAEFMSLMLRTAIATNNTINLQQAVRIIGYFGYDQTLLTQDDTTRETTKALNKRNFINEKFNSALADAVDLLLKGDRHSIQSSEMAEFERLGQQARRPEGT